MREPEISLALVGFGNVARRFVRLLDEAADRLDFEWKLVGLSPRHEACSTRMASIARGHWRSSKQGNHSIGSTPTRTRAAGSISSGR